MIHALPIRALSQRNTIWANLPLGFSQATIGSHGCAITALAMLLNALHPHAERPHTPDGVNATLRTANAYTGVWRNYVNWPSIGAVYPDLQFNDRIDAPRRWMRPAELHEIDRRLDQELPVIAYVDAGMKEPGLQQHFVLVIGLETDTGIYQINDPWHGDMAPLCPRYGSTPARALCGLILLDRS